jgi:hypothetical protein
MTAVPPMDAPPPTREDRRPEGALDGALDTFVGVRSGTVVRFRARLVNTSVRESLFPQVFFVRVALVGDGLLLRETLVRIIVPEGPKFDAGPEHDVHASQDASTEDAFADATAEDALGLEADGVDPHDA